MTQPSFKDIENLTAYLDGQLDAKQTHLLESRLTSEQDMRTTLEELRATRALFRRMPQRRAPRNFTLSPKMAGIKPPAPRSYSVLRFASGFAMFLLFFAFAANFIAPIAAQQTQLASAPMLGGGMGGGAPIAAEADRTQSGGGCDGCVEPTMEALAPAPAATENPASQTEEYAQQANIQPTGEPATKAAPLENIQPAPVSVPLVVSPLWMGLLLGVAVLAGGLAVIVRFASDRKWSKANAAVSQGLTRRDILLLVLAILLVVAAVIGIVQLAKASGMAQAPVGGEAPVMAVEESASLPPGDKGSVPPGDKGNTPTAVPQTFTLSPEMGYGFSYADFVGRLIAIDFPVGVVDAAADALFTTQIDTTMMPQGYFFSGSGFTLVVSPKDLTPRVPITITFNYVDREIGQAVDETQFYILWWNGSEWVDAITTCDPVSEYERLYEENQVRINACQFGTYIFVGVQ